MTCPAGLDVPTYVTLVGLGRFSEAVDVIRRDCPFPWVCGLVCTRPCEFMCVRGRIDKPIAIKSLKAFAAERSMSDGTYDNPKKAPDKNRKVCVVGAGPGGLSAAYYLALKGFQVRVLEAQNVPGGMLLLGIPRYRLPREVIDREVAMIEELGVEIVYNTRFGTDVTMADLKKEGFEAFLFTIGAHNAFKLNIPGEDDYPQVIEAVAFLRRVALGDRRVPGKSVAVIGGGNVAIDAARTCLRLGCRNVTLAYRRSRSEMPADEEEVEHAEEEGIKLDFLTIPVEIEGEADQVTGLRCLRAKLVEIEGSMRKSPKPIENSDFVMDVDVVISAIGQKVDNDCMRSVGQLKWSRRNTISANMVSMETSVPGVFAAGDAVTGPATVIEAIGAGKRAANAIDRYLAGIPQPKIPPVPVRRGRVDWIDVTASSKMTHKRPQMPLLMIERRRTTFQQVELGLDEAMVKEESRRCLRCDVCLRCGKCVEICRDKMGVNALEMGYFDFDHPVETDFRITQERCILCGACAANCPTGAMKMIDSENERVLSLCGTILNRQELVHCDECHAVLGPARYLDFIRKRGGALPRVITGKPLCDVCSRKTTAARKVEDAPVK
jgi:NADPH-dependent glutamate synthase beta subunit-like oxidoreductase